MSEAERRVVAAWAATCAVKAAVLMNPDRRSAAEDEISWQVSRLLDEQVEVLRQLPLLGEDAVGPLGPGLLASGVLGDAIRPIRARLRA